MVISGQKRRLGGHTDLHATAAAHRDRIDLRSDSVLRTDKDGLLSRQQHLPCLHSRFQIFVSGYALYRLILARQMRMSSL